jgi:acyl-CoA thioester hydrolase
MTRTPLRVRYPEADRMGVAYHANYFVWFELGRTDLMRRRGCSYREMEDEEGIILPVINAGASYLSPARYDDELEVLTRLASVERVRVRFEYELLRPADGKSLANGFSEHAVVGRDGRPMRMPREIRERLQSMESGS